MDRCPKIEADTIPVAGTVCWTVQLLPQLWYSYRLKSTEGLSEWLMYDLGPSRHRFLGTDDNSLLQKAHLGYCWSVLGDLFGSPKLEHPSNPPTATVRRAVVRIMGTGSSERASLCMYLPDRSVQCQYYGRKRSKATSVVMFFAAVAIFAGFEAGMIYIDMIQSRRWNCHALSVPGRVFQIR